MKRRIIEFLIRYWMPKYKLARIRGPYKKRVVGATITLHMEDGSMVSPPPEFTTAGIQPEKEE